MKYYKVLRSGGKSTYGDFSKWILPSKDGKPGRWMPTLKGEIKCGVNGYHLIFADFLKDHLGEEIYEAEGRGDSDESNGTIAFRQARLIRKLPWDGQLAIEFACQCVEHVLYLWKRKRKHPGDDLAEYTIEVVRRWWQGKECLRKLEAVASACWRAGWGIGGLLARDGAPWVIASRVIAEAQDLQANDAVDHLDPEGAWARGDTTLLEKIRATYYAAWMAERHWQSQHLCKMLGIEDPF